MLEATYPGRFEDATPLQKGNSTEQGGCSNIAVDDIASLSDEHTGPHDRGLSVPCERLERRRIDVVETDPGAGRAVAYHGHCQQRTLKPEAPTVALLKTFRYDVEFSSVEWCGMAGSLGPAPTNAPS